MIQPVRFPAVLWIAFLALVGCEREAPSGAGAELQSTPVETVAQRPATGERSVRYTEEREPCTDYAPLRQPLYGDLHVHTSFSFDAAANSIGATPDDAHRFARGEGIDFWPLDDAGDPAGKFAIDRPLDFLAVTDHGEFLGERAICRTPGSPAYDMPFCTAYRQDQQQGMIMLAQVVTTETPVRVPEVCGDDGAQCLGAAREPWGRMIEAAEAAYDRTAECSFTSFVGYEYTGTPGVSNYHRNVIFRNGNVPELPVSYVDAPVDSELWRRLDESCLVADGCSYLTIPHNTNLANGRMAPYMGDGSVESRRAYAAVRLEREPIVEIFQHKGASECINGLTAVMGAPDELCDIEAVRVIGREETYVDTAMVDGEPVMEQRSLVTEECGDGVGTFGMLGAGCVDATDFVRSALVVGLREERETGMNPVKLGIIASTDTHTATPGAVSESDYRGAVTGEATPARDCSLGCSPPARKAIRAVSPVSGLSRIRGMPYSKPCSGGKSSAPPARASHRVSSLAGALMRGCAATTPWLPMAMRAACPWAATWAMRRRATPSHASLRLRRATLRKARRPFDRLELIKGWVDVDARCTARCARSPVRRIWKRVRRLSAPSLPMMNSMHPSRPTITCGWWRCPRAAGAATIAKASERRRRRCAATAACPRPSWKWPGRRRSGTGPEAAHGIGLRPGSAWRWFAPAANGRRLR